MDLVKVPMALADIQKTAITTLFGLFKYVFMPFRQMNAAQTFQLLMDRLFCDLPFVFTYLDDHLIAITSPTFRLLHIIHSQVWPVQSGCYICRG